MIKTTEAYFSQFLFPRVNFAIRFIDSTSEVEVETFFTNALQKCTYVKLFQKLFHYKYLFLPFI